MNDDPKSVTKAPITTRTPTMRRYSKKSTAMIYSAATSLLLLSTMDGSDVSAAVAADGKSNASVHGRRLPQHRVRTAKRQVPYPGNHPLGRHLKKGSERAALLEEKKEDESIVGGDGSRSRRRQQQQQQQQRQQQNHHRFLRFLNHQKSTPNPTKRRRRRDVQNKEPEAIQEGRLIENNQGDTLRYWTISGRNLVTSIVNATDGQNYGSSETLLMDVERINVENGEARLIQSENNEDDRESRSMEDDTVFPDDFDTDQYYNHQEASNEQSAEPEDATLDAEEPSNSLYQPIRLRAIFTDDETSGSKYLTPSQRKILMEDIINPALYAWSKALHVVPIGGGGRRGMDDKLVVDQSQLYDGVSCGPGLDSGLPSVRVPQEHMTDGLADTDTVIYISVFFVENAEPVSTTAPKSTESPLHSLYHLHRGASGPTYGGSTRRKGNNETNQTTAYPSSSPSSSPSFPPSETEPYVETRPTCPGTYLASATYCSSDQHDRPVAGILSLCISDVHHFFYNQEQIKRNIVTIMHEIGHILGFNAQSLANFRDPDTGQPSTPRDEHGDVPDGKVECTGVSPRVTSEIPLPSKDIMKFRSVRGGVRVATIVTPTVQRVARNMFGCRTLLGAELESGEGQMFATDEEGLSAGECIGDHWARRLFRTDLMNTIVDDVPYSLYISSLTLAYFVDSGWYEVDTDRIAPSSMWGRNAGCNFVEKKCITAGGQVHASNNPFFCNNFLEYPPEEEITEIHGCDLDSSRKAVCSLVEYDSPIPEPYNYFEQDKYLDHTHYYGGSDPTLDYCPIFEGFSNGQCDNEESKKLMEVRSSLEVFGEDNSRCVIGHVDKKRTALCLPIACVIQEQSLMVKVDGYWKPCSYAGQIMSVWWNPNDYVVCPDPSRMCPTFYCPNDCFRDGGICDYQTGQCMCATSTNSSIANTTSWFSNYYSYERFEPCSGEHPHFGASNEVVERIDFELPDYYVENTTVLLDDPRDFDDKVSRMFRQLSSGEVVGLVASFMFCVIFSFIVSSQLVKCYKRRILRTSLSKVRSSVGSLSRMLRSASRSSLDNDGHDAVDSPPSHRRPQGGHNHQKDKMVATLLVQMRTEGTAVAEQEHQRRLQLGGLTSTMSGGVDSSSNTQTIVGLSSSSKEDVLVNRSQLPPLPEGRILAVVGAQIVEDDVMGNGDARSSVTSATQLSSHHSEISEFTSPLYHDDDDGRNTGGRMLRLRRHIE
mmetsp:Transcript_27092/g.48877  ORF Transcript_27092/g.48877 Transcript_27092/m.48877 type:complete len:1218 (-) Transcript_27092:184-3837(-)